VQIQAKVKCTFLLIFSPDLKLKLTCINRTFFRRTLASDTLVGNLTEILVNSKKLEIYSSVLFGANSRITIVASSGKC